MNYEIRIILFLQFAKSGNENGFVIFGKKLMSRRYKILFLSLAVLGVVSFAPFFAAAEESVAGDVVLGDEASQVLAEDAALADEPEIMEGFTVEQPESVPSNLGLWWRDLSERISLVLTLDPVKKAEKQVKFAEEKIKLAEYIVQNSSDVKAQEKAQQMMEKANEYIQRVEEHQDDLLRKADERVAVLLKNVVRHQANKEAVLQKLEEKLPPEKLDKLYELRERAEAQREKFFAEMEDSAAPQAVKDKVAEIKARVEAASEEQAEFRQQQKEILEKIKEGNQEAKEELNQLRQSWSEKSAAIKDQYQEKRSEIIDKIKAGDQDAVKELKQINQERRVQLKDARQEIKSQIKDVQQERKTNVQTGKQELRENRVERKTEIKKNVLNRVESPLNNQSSVSPIASPSPAGQ